MLNSWKQTFVTLIPKCQDTYKLGHYKPISLCNTLYKIYAKLIVYRMKPILSCHIDPEQGAFVGSRSIYNNILIAQEFMFDLRKTPSNRSLMAIKLDMERAYNHMHWWFLEKALSNFGFHPC